LYDAAREVGLTIEAKMPDASLVIIRLSPTGNAGSGVSRVTCGCAGNSLLRCSVDLERRCNRA
jgi:hypothetical protein